MYKCAYDIRPCVTLACEVEWSCLQAGEYFDEIVKEAHL